MKCPARAVAFTIAFAAGAAALRLPHANVGQALAKTNSRWLQNDAKDGTIGGRAMQRYKASTFTPTELACKLIDAVNSSMAGISSASSPSGQRLPHYGTCAVVSSSGVLTLHEHGDRIDSADLVIRFNTAPVAGWERYVGSRDDFRVVNEKVLDEWLDGEQVDILKNGVTYTSVCTVCNVGEAHTVTPTAFAQRQAALKTLYPSIGFFSSNLQLESSLEHFFWQFYGVLQSNAGITTGGVGMLLALSMCDEVHAYGMASSTHMAPSVPYSYWESSSSHHLRDTKEWHLTFGAEKDFWRALAANAKEEIDADDIAVIPGFSKVTCPEASLSALEGAH